MKNTKLLISIGSILCGILITSVVYASQERLDIPTFIKTFIIVSTGSIITIIISYLCIKKYGDKKKTFRRAIFFSYTAFILLFVILGGAEALMWLLVFIMFAIPFCAPVIFLSYYGTLLLIRSTYPQGAGERLNREH